MPYERGERQEKIHSSAAVKFDVRRAAYESAGPGRIWVPYCGPGEVALKAGYDPARCVAVDNDQAAVRAWREKLSTAEVHACDVEKFDAWGSLPYSYADIDPFGAPWKALQMFLDHAPLTDPVVIAVTDGFVAKKTQLGRFPYDFERHRPGLKDSEAATAEVREWPRAAVRWLESLGWHVHMESAERAMAGGAGVRYCWMRLSRQAIAAAVQSSAEPPKPRRLSLRGRLFAEARAAGMTLCDAAKAAGSKARNLSQAGAELLRKPEVIAEIERLRAELRERCADDIAGAVEVLRSIAADPERNDRDRIEAVRLLVRRAGESWGDPKAKGKLDLEVGITERAKPEWSDW